MKYSVLKCILIFTVQLKRPSAYITLVLIPNVRCQYMQMPLSTAPNTYS
jgi:hypothetical protein